MECGWGRSPAFHGGARGGIADAEKLIGEAKKMLGHLWRHCGKRRLWRRNIADRFCSRRMRRTDIVASLIGQNLLGQKPQLGKPKPDDGSVCDELQDARAAEFFFRWWTIRR